MDNVGINIVNHIFWRVMQSRVMDKIRTVICRTPVFRLEGKTRTSQFDLSTLTFAGEETTRYFSELAYSDEVKIKYLGKTTYHSIPSAIADEKPDIVFAEFDRMFSKYLYRRFLLLPYIDTVLDISVPWDVILSRMRRDRRRGIREIKDRSYIYEITRDIEKFNLFYYKMYLPFCKKRHGKKARFIPVIYSKKTFQKGGLLLVKLDGKYVSGILYGLNKNTLFVPQHAVYLGRDEYIAGQAALYFLMRWAKEKGYRQIDYGSTPPFANDGLFRYKRSWGMKIRPVSRFQKILGMRLCNFGNAVRDFLKENPFIFLDSERLQGLVLLDSNETDLRSIRHHYHTPGLSGLVIFHAPENTPPATCIPIHEISSGEKPRPLKSLARLASKIGIKACFLELSSERHVKFRRSLLIPVK